MIADPDAAFHAHEMLVPRSSASVSGKVAASPLG